MMPNALRIVATLPKGTKLTVVTGDPGQPGPFVLRVYFPANTVSLPTPTRRPRTSP
jgi:hypothetical protein